MNQSFGLDRGRFVGNPEVQRLRLGSIPWKSVGTEEPRNVDKQTCLLHVPVNKTSAAFVKPDSLVGREIEAWEKVRPEQPAKRKCCGCVLPSTCSNGSVLAEHPQWLSRIEQAGIPGDRHSVRAEMRRVFPRRLYRRRALIESVSSSVKRKLSARAPGRSLRMQVRQALLLGLSFNLYRLRHRHLFLRMSTEPPGFKTVLIIERVPS